MDCKACNIVNGVAKLLVIIGAINWGLIGFFKYNLIAEIFGGNELATGARVFFALIGIAGVSELFCWIRSCCCGCQCNGNCGPNCKCGPNCSCKCCKK